MKGMVINMLKRLYKITGLAICCFILAGCGNEAVSTEVAVEETEETEFKSKFQKRVGASVPEAYTKKDKEVTWEVKATNHQYDIENMNYRLVWSDEFDYEGKPDETKWSYDVGGSGWGNQELQYYTDDGNAWVEDGKLIIECREEEKEGCEYTSARLVTRGKGDWTYGKFEICAKLPTGKGTWPAIWMLPTDWTYGNWPSSGEIDIMEHVGYDQDVIHASIHTKSYYHSINTQKTATIRKQGVSEDFHVYGLEWLPDQIIMTIDGEEYFRFDPNKYVAAPSVDEWPFDQRMHLLLNIAFGGGWGGAKGIDPSVLPQRMEIDYVRVYQSPLVSDFTVEEEVENPFLKADGKVLKDNYGTGNIVQLKGTNVGGYMLQEFWMTPTSTSENVKAQADILNVLTRRFGQAEAARLIDLYESHYFTEEDFDFCKSLGMNCLRLPFWYRNLVDENGTLYENAFDRMDWFVEQAAKRDMYVILDMHGAPGSQNASDHSGKDGGNEKEAQSNFFFGEDSLANQELYYSLWEKIAEHYKGNAHVAGYDLLNEPYCTYRYNSHLSDQQLHTLLWDIYDTAYQKIRSIDSDHVIIMEATWNPEDLPDPEKYNWENIMYEYHNYLYDDYDNKAGKQITNMKSKLDAIARANYNVPSYMGEFAYFNNLDAWEEGIALINNSGISWTTWTYKVVDEYGNWGIRNQAKTNLNLETATVEQIEEKWSMVGESHENEALCKILSKYFNRMSIGQ